MPNEKVVQFPERDALWSTIAHVLEDELRNEHLSEDASREIFEWARSAYDEFGRPTQVSLKLTVPEMNPAQEQILINSIIEQVNPVIRHCEQLKLKMFVRYVGAKVLVKKLQPQRTILNE
jgi:hypothetical protein